MPTTATLIGAPPGGGALATQDLAAVCGVDCLAERDQISRGDDHPVRAGRDELLHSGVLADDHRNAARERLGGGVGEPVLVSGVDAEAGAEQPWERIAG